MTDLVRVVRRLARSLSFRLLIIFLVMGLLFAYGAILGIRWVYVTDDLRELVSGHLQLHVNYVRDDIGSPPSIVNALEITRTVPVDIRITGPDVDWASDPDFPSLDELVFGSSDIFSDAAEGWLRGLEGVEFATRGAHGFLKIEEGDYSIVVSSPKIAQEVQERSLAPIIVGFGLLLVLLAYLAVRWLFKPLSAIRHGAKEIGRGNFSHRITAVRRDQLGDLAGDINTMAYDVEAMLDAKRQLLFGISHELRTPLSRMKLGLAMMNDDNASGLAEDVEEMEKIISTLLEAERLNTRHAAINLTRVSAHRLVTALIDDYFDRDRERIAIRVSEDLYFNVDEVRIGLMIKNLLSNALRYSRPEDGPVSVEITTTDDAWVIRVSDHGPGIPAEQVDKIGEPFYRGDPSRTRTTGGSGLGLYIARLVAQVHGGELELDRSVTQGASFVVRLPFEPAEA
ncbi:MAG: HAMP domain-containing sensor histidine kinase [Woeseiaceae bacterium]|nr:HAMP domain-containing sensor histidine kinase [Woeseiaceae bacterium]